MPVAQLFAAPSPAPWDAKSLEFMQRDLARSALVPEDLNAYPISTAKYDAPAYCIPYKDNDKLWRVRIDREKDKYLATPNCAPDIWLPPDRSLEDLYDGDLYIVEGEKKAAAVYKYWQLPNVVGIGGCWNAVVKSEKQGAYRLIDKLHLLMTPGRVIHLILDGDVIDNKNVGRAAITLAACIEACNCSMNLYRPPNPEYKGVDDWLWHEKSARPEHLELVDLSKLSINRSLLYSQLELTVGPEGGLILNESNGVKLLEYHFKSLGVMKDKRLGFINAEGQPVKPAWMDRQALDYLQVDINPRYSSGAINGAFATYLNDPGNEVDLVRDLLATRLKWDGVPRLETWGSQHFETTLPKLADEWGRLLITGMAMRILEPGCKFDTVCILCGTQGIGKTTFFEDLAVIDGHSFYKSVLDIPGSTGDERTFKQTLAGALVVDLGEGVIFESKKTSNDKLKQFITDRVDEYRVAYAKTNTVSPLGYVIVGTTNRTDQLSDYTGSRRFLYLSPTKITRLEYATKLQLLAEAAATVDQIKSGPWYDLRLTMDDIPKAMVEENSHITNVNELLNTQHYRSDSLTEQLLLMIENDVFSRLNGTNEAVVTSIFVAAKLSSSNLIHTANTVGRKLIELDSSPQFPYRFIKTRKRGAQMDYKQGHKELYTGHISNDQVMFTCFIIQKK